MTTAHSSSEGHYCIIGAGAAGMASLREFLDAGVSVDCFEKSDRIGGHWNTDYEALHLITSRTVSGFPGYPMPEHFPVYPSRLQVVEYLNDFADHFDLRRHITFNTAVADCQPVGPAGRKGWEITTADGTRTIYDGVIVANGHLWSPAMPAISQKYAGRSIHSGQFTNTDDILGAKVLVVGSGNSGCDLAADTAQHRIDTTISIRSGHIFQPKSIFGRPRSEISWLSKLPSWLQERMTRLLIRIVLGQNSDYPGLPEPATNNLNEQLPVVNNLLLYWIHHGRITPAPGIRDITGTTVEFDDGARDSFDTILWATGFEVSLPFIDNSLLTWRDSVPLRHGAMTVPVGLERLYFVGMSAPRGAQMPPYSYEARLVLSMMELDETLPNWANALFDRDEPSAAIDTLRNPWFRELSSVQDKVCKALRSARGDAQSRPGKKETSVAGGVS